MPIIQPYEERVVAQGVIGTRANPDDFGASVGSALQHLGGAISSQAEDILKAKEAEDVTNVHVNMAKARAEWTKTLQARENAAQPGDETFVPSLVKDLEDFTTKGAGSATTKAGRRLYQTLAANMTSEFTQAAVRIQSELAAKAAANKFDTMKQGFGSTVFQDHTQLPAVQALAAEAIDDPKGAFRNVPQPVRDRYKAQLAQDVNFAAARGFVQKYPEATLQSIAPDQLAQFNPWKILIDANTAPGGHVQISPETTAKASEFTAEASAKGLNPNILMAQNDAAAGDKPAPKDMAASMSFLVNRYGGNYEKALAAYRMGTEALDGVLSANGSDWQGSIPKGVLDYVGAVLEKSGSVASPAPEAAAPVPATPAAPRQPVTDSAIPAFNGLSWEQQDHIVKEGVQLQHMRMTMAVHARNEQQFQLEQAQKVAMDDVLKRIVEPRQFGRITEDEILKNETISWNQKQHAIDYMFTRQRELKNAADTKTNPEEVRRLLLQLYAAPDDPNKTYSVDPTMESYKLGRISTNEMMLIRREVDGLRDGSANGFQKQVQNASNVVHDTFTKSVEGTVQPGIAAEGWYRFKFDMDRQIAAKREKNEDPRPLLDPSSREYLLKPERLQQFMTGAKEAVKGAAKVKAEQQKLTLPTYKDYARLKKGESFTDPQGNVRTKP